MEMKRLDSSARAIKEKEINLKEIAGIIMKRLWIVIVLTGLITTLGYLYNSKPEPQYYSSSTRVIISANNDMMNTVKVMVREPIVLSQVIDMLELDQSVGQMRSQIRVANVDNSLVTVITATNTDPNRAADIANTTVEVFRKVAADTLGVSNIRLLTPAEPVPVSITVKTNTIVYLAFAAGLILSLTLVFLLESLDDTIRSEREIERLLELNMLGHVSVIKRRAPSSAGSNQPKQALNRSETIGS
ncbi:Wzz/FepE/Etk N-terminal domain-containing protein [Paenibacillus sp. J5C_2022]|uniref:YveK family protein n=1 Tax=Paenibacillus sp. J5C2022 TaxID=2977129 RepID=UPI0021D28291|nr:Wzz/FepE/Etk N-terminal domain-containing protein [Paenibacillus sp. J5C2022]MCU6710309.1 Wzz/FepE/Etk N-terminal domain-containing protein [Paenibacillus sp. J5C2022]